MAQQEVPAARPHHPTDGLGAVSLQHVTKRYGAEAVVDDISLDIQSGEFFSLLGPSGSGKTTTLMMIAGFADVDGGRILVDGEDITAKSPQARGFGMVFQNYAIFPHLNVFENVAFPLRARGAPEADIKRRVGDALALVRLERFADRFSRQLSGGQQQRVAIARAIVFEPRVVLMDEPLGALDKNLRYDMQIEIKEIQRQLGMTVVYVTHDQEEAMNMSDRIGVMNRGRIEQVAAPGDMYEQPVNAFIGRFLGEANLVEGTLQGASSAGSVLRISDNLLLRTPQASADLEGKKVNLFIRPERVAMSAHAADNAGAETNCITGRVRRRSFLGNIHRYVVAVGRAEITVDVQNASGAGFGIGDDVVLTWAVADSLVLGS
jgi:spermidine/putrescine ABC transporter ATP-binding subunit